MKKSFNNYFGGIWINYKDINLETLFKETPPSLRFLIYFVAVMDFLLLVLIGVGNIPPTTQSNLAYIFGASIILPVLIYAFMVIKRPDLLKDSHANSENINDIEKKVDEWGIIDIFSGRSVTIEDEYDKRLKVMKKELDILGFGLSHFRKDYNKSFIEIAGKAKVRILLLNPDFPEYEKYSISDIRDEEEGQTKGTIRSQVEEFISDYKKMKKELKNDKFEVRLYNSLPTVNIFKIDNEMFVGPYLMDRDSRRTITILIDSKGDMFEQHLEHFDEIWDNYSDKIDIEEWVNICFF